MKLDDLSREELYEKVWSKSGVKLSAEFGISDVAIAKRCRKLNI
jgi:biotin operon repressor